MSVAGKLAKYWRENTPLIVGFGLIVGIHWVWYRIQYVPKFVAEHERQDMPLFKLAKFLKDKITTGPSLSEMSTEEIKLQTAKD